MNRLTRSFCDKDLEINNFLGLDSDELLEKGSELICLCDGLYVPQRVSPQLFSNRKTVPVLYFYVERNKNI